MTGRAACLIAAGVWLTALCALPVHAVTPEFDQSIDGAGPVTGTSGHAGEPSRTGEAEAAFALGLLYDLGSVIKRDAVSALYWYKTAAAAGLAAGAFNVGALYDSGRGVPRDSAQAAVWYAKAAARGHHRAQFDLGQLYEEGDGVPRNPDAAAVWYRDAADGGITAALRRLKTLKAAGRTRPGGNLVPVTSSSPSRNETLALTDDNPAVELVWIAPPEPQPVHYQLKVQELDGTTLRTVFTASLTETAVQVRLPTTPDFYVWNVDTVGQDGSHAPSEWTWFSVGTPTPSQQSAVSSSQVAPAIQ